MFPLTGSRVASPIQSLNDQKGYREDGQPFFSSRKLAGTG
jgi:hypothetical protein